METVSYFHWKLLCIDKKKSHADPYVTSPQLTATPI